MARPRTPISSHGIVNTVEHSPGVWRARTLYRFPDGKRRQVERVRAGKTDAKAIQALKQALVDMATPGDADVKSSTSLAQLADMFLQSKIDAEKTPRTIDTYRHQIEKIIKPRIGDLRVAEATTGRLQRFFTTVAKEHGHGAAKGCRSVLSGMFGIAVRNDVLRANPVLGVAGIQKTNSRAATALPLDGVAAFRASIRADDELCRLDIVDLFDFMLFTGCRIGEALALRWTHVDFEANGITFSATVSRARGLGLILQEHGKTESSSRTITVAADVLELLRARDRVSELVFPSMLGKLRDTSNTESDWRANRDRLGYPGLTTHTFRKTVATALDVAGLSARAIAEYLGHKQPSMTQDVYMSRNTGSAAAAAKLGAMFGDSSE
jgi:integrase